MIGGHRRKLPLAKPACVVGVACLGLAALGAFYWLARTPFLSGQSDDAMYLASAKALASGQGYVLAMYPDAPANTFFPPGYALVLSAFWGLLPPFPASLAPLQLFSLLSTGVLLALGALVLARVYRAEWPAIVLAVALVATTPVALVLSTALGSDTLYAILGLASVWLVGDGRHRPRRLLLGSLCAVAAYYVRTIGIVLVVALALVGLVRWHRGCRARGTSLLWPLLALLPWLLWTSAHGGASYVAVVRSGVPGYAPPLTDPRALLGVVGANALRGVDALWDVAPALVDVPLLGTLLLAWALLRAWQRWRQSGEVAPVYVGLYLLALLVWPWQVPGRFVWPIALLLAVDAVQGLQVLWSRVSQRWGHRLPQAYLIVVALVLGVNAIGLWAAAERLRTDGWIRGAEALGVIQAHFILKSYLDGHIAPAAVLGTNHWNNGAWWWLYTGHQTLDGAARADGQGAFFLGGRSAGDERLIDYFIYEPFDGVAGADDWPLVHDRLEAQGAPQEPLYCTEGYKLCLYQWRAGATARRP
jgi:hypothetical protein